MDVCIALETRPLNAPNVISISGLNAGVELFSYTVESGIAFTSAKSNKAILDLS